MKLLIVGFNDYNVLDKELSKLIVGRQLFLFTVICGGTDKEKKGTSLGEQWAAANGAPIEYLFCENPEMLLDRMAQTADYILADLSNGNQFVRRIVMKMRSMGKHGTIRR